MAQIGDKKYESWEMVSSGYAAVWAKENTRAAIFDAMMRKETYATTGPRMTVRFFGGWNFTEKDAQSRWPGNIGYTKGVPMGGKLRRKPDAIAPTFLAAGTYYFSMPSNSGVSYSQAATTVPGAYGDGMHRFGATSLTTNSSSGDMCFQLEIHVARRKIAR